jgi:hypothetical protein
VRPAAVVNALPDFAFAAVFLVTWFAPGALGAGTVERLLLVMMLEFVIIHSAAFMGTLALRPADRGRKSLSMVALGFFYSIFAGAMSLAFRTWWPLAAFWVQTGNRLLGVLSGRPPAGTERAQVMSSWVVSVVLYLGCVGVTSVLPIPPLGLTAPVIDALHLPGSGVWVDEPYRVIAFGFLYFALTGWWELVGPAWLARRIPARS